MRSLRCACFLFCIACLAAATTEAGVIKGKVKAPSGVKSVVVYVDTIAGKTFNPPAKHAVMNQRHLEFEPHVMAVLKGTTVDFVNSDTVMHNVYWPRIGGNKRLARNLGTWPRGQHKSHTFDHVGAVPLLCNVHPEMSGYLIVVPTPYFAVSKAGIFEIKGVPPGKYTLKTWSEKGKPLTQAVTVGAGTTTVNLTIH